ncbi:MAG: glycoside hydrolase family 3 C-terminal domain-containing protein [Erythrobacter sp.]|nr:glycoside hydrolase family 3 C-terminal domain-containing protein [Erythrobacter sp.]
MKTLTASGRLAALLLASCASVPAAAQASAEERAAVTEAQMTDAERTQLTLGYMSMEVAGVHPPEGALPGAGIVPGVPRLNVPPLWETDASLGVVWVGGARGNGGTQLPSGTAQGATWNPELIEAGGRMIGSEAHAKGYNVLLAGGINLMREARNGRTFEYIGEDPLLSGVLGGAAVRGIQSNHIISTVKHFAINPQETGRHYMNVEIDEASLRESDLLAFEIAIEQGNPGSVMCAYNRINGPLSCDSHFLLTDVLRDDWGYQGFVMSDWGAVEGLDFALAGLDQQSGAQLDEGLFMDVPLREAAQSDPRYRTRLGEMARRVLWAIYANNLDTNLPEMTAVDSAANSEVALQVAQEGIVLLRNQAGSLPLSSAVNSIAVIGGNADTGTMVGGGSSRVFSDEGPAAMVPMLRGGEARFANFMDPAFNRSVPLDAIRDAAPDARVSYRDGRYLSEAALAASQADVAIVFVNQFQTEGLDVPDLSLPQGQDALVAAVATANPNTIVVIQSGGPVTMPWLDDVAAVVEAWYPGARGGEAIADVLFGAVNPSGHLPITFPASEAQLPRPELPGARTVTPSFLGRGEPGATLDADYAIEGSDVGYRWFARQGLTPLFPFGHGLSYTTFSHDGLQLRNRRGEVTASFAIANTGDREGADVAQLYLTRVNGETRQRLVGFARRDLQPGESAQVSVTVDPRLLAEWENDGWQIASGDYTFALGASATDLGPEQTIRINGFRLDSSGARER